MLGTLEQSIKKAHSVKAAAQLFDASIPFVRNEIRDGNLRAKKIGRKVVILDADLQSYLENQPDWASTNSK
ncbi:MAG: helix-turn-helix domain-containing protein [Acidobacteria bacterium]|jgi:excisionase family DNA binding protein|nr:helix-turn-helix domain-containing protein [Acidobacteriota bacterium]